MAKINVKDTEITVISIGEKDYISLTDMVKNIENGLSLIEKWLRNKNTIEFIGIWEEMYNPVFNSPEFEGIKNAAGLNRFILSVKQWRENNPNLRGNIRDYASINELICLSNMENLNAVFIQDGLPQKERLIRLNQIAIQQMKVLQDAGQRKYLN